MHAETARRFAELTLRHGGEQNDFLFYVKDAEPDAEYQRIKLMIGHTMGSLYADALYWIFKEHPDLRPPELSK